MRIRGATRLGKMAVIVPAAFINSLAIGTMALGILFVVKDLYGAGPAMVGSLGAVWSTSYFIGCIVLRKAANRLRPRTSMFIMLSGSAAILTAFLLAPGLWRAFAAYAAYGFITAFFWPPLMGWLSKGLEGAELNKATSLFSFSWSVGGIFSSYIAGLLSERGKFLPIALSAALFAANAVFVLASRSFVREDETVAHDAGRADEPAVDRSTALRYPAWLGAFLIYAVMGVVLNVFPVFARDELALSESSIGLVLTIRATATAIGFFVLGKVTFWQFKRAALPALSIATAGALIALTLQRGAIGFAIGFAAIGILQSVMYNNSLFYATSGASDRNKRASVHEALLTFGQVVGSVSGGLLYQAFSMSAVFVGLSLLLALGAGAQSAMVYRPGRSGSRIR
ncbi:MAG: MFS transporter [Spirochaetes bacterium]|nr:MFS transporter [Spirochaetota bacterium]MBU1081388.1 MFS transporter [Spirochaetota bacterium]